jgi:putative serine protease PepD
MSFTRKRTLAGLAAALAVGVGAGAGGYAVVDGSSTAPSSAPATSTVTTVSPVASTSGEMSVNQIWRSAGPGVVDITVSSTQASSNRFPFPGGGTQQAEGSGFVYDASGDIVTNDHVVNGANTIRVKLESGKTYTAKLVGEDPSTDLAVVKIDAPSNELKPLALGDSSDVEVGDGVVAIGSPFGLAGTVTSGIVSALNRTIQAPPPNQFSILGAIQTDAAINHGNSGGPLLDLQGKVIGINSQIQSDSGGNDGVGFAIPSNTVKRVVSQLISGGKVEHAFLGVSLSPPTTKIAQVRAGTPADQAGLQVGDVVTSIDGKPVSTTTALQAAIDAKRPGDEVKVAFTRGGSDKTVTVKLGTRPS